MRRCAGIGETARRDGQDGKRRDRGRRGGDEQRVRIGPIRDQAARDGGERAEVVVVVEEAGGAAGVLVREGGVSREERHESQDEHAQPATICPHAARQSILTAIDLQRVDPGQWLKGAGRSRP